MRHLAIMALLGATACGQSNSEQPDNREPQGSPSVDRQTAEAGSEKDRLWVTSARLQRRTCPSIRCGVVGQLFFREAADVLERKGEWARITKIYDASCEGGHSHYVDSGNDACTPENGISDGRFAEWVLSTNLSRTRPADPAETASPAERLVAQSDDFTRYRVAFVRAADELITSGRCSAADFEEQGGWMKSSNHRDAPVYFTYCGEMTIPNRIYLNAKTGRIYQE